MTYTYCEAAMWHIMMPAAFRYLSETNSDWDIPALKRRSKQIYRQIVSRTPDIGSMIKNPLRVCMTGGMLWLSVFEAAEGHMSEECFANSVIHMAFAHPAHHSIHLYCDFQHNDPP